MDPKPKTIFEKIWDRHVVFSSEGHPDLLYINTHYIHEVTSPQAFDGLRKRGLKVHRPDRTFATADHNVPTLRQDLPIKEELSRFQVEQLTRNCSEFGIDLYGLGHPWQGIVHIIGPELGITLPGMTVVCGDSHTSTHGAFGTIAFGIGTSEVEEVLATQCILQYRPKTMKVEVNGRLQPGVLAKDIILHIISRLSSAGGTGYFIEFAGSAITSLSMEGRMTICNMSIELGARGGLIAPDETTFTYLKRRSFAPVSEGWKSAVETWKSLPSDEGAVYDQVEVFDASQIEPMITYGTNPGMGMKVGGSIPRIEEISASEKESFQKSLRYMGFDAGTSLLGHPVDYVFIGSCTNSRIEDLRLVAGFVKGRTKDPEIIAWIVPGSRQVLAQAIEEGLDLIFKESGFEIREPGCSACLGMNEDKIPAGKYAVSTSNRNFEGRQGPGSRTILVSPLTAALAAVTGRIGDITKHLS